jgi:ABC-2 type transport system permease protein
MSGRLGAILAGARAEASQLRRSPLLVLLAAVQAVTFLLLVSLFGLTGSRAPTAIVDEDHGPMAAQFIAQLANAHRSFALRSMSREQAMAQLSRGELVAMVTIPHGFSEAVQRGDTVPIGVTIDNVDADLTDDVQRALPSAIGAFAQKMQFTGIRLHPAERDVINHDTDFIPYLVVSALALDALIVAGVLAAISVAREFEGGTAAVLSLSPTHPLGPIAGRVVTTAAVSLAAMAATTVIVVAGYGVVPQNPVELLAGLAMCVAIFSCVGVALGALIRRTLPVTALVFGIALPLYIDSGSLEPERFDGNVIWALAHLSPVYYAVGVLEDAFHGLQVTPEPVWLDLVALAAWAAVAMLAAMRLLSRRVAR